MSQICFQIPSRRRVGSGLVKEVYDTLKKMGEAFHKVVRDKHTPARLVVHTKGTLGADTTRRLNQLGLE